MFSKTCEYAIRAIIYIYNKSNGGESKFGIKEIATEIQSPEHFTAKILQLLRRQEIVSSTKGPNGGFYMNSRQGQLNLLEIVKAVDGPHSFTGCILGLSECDATKPCPIHASYQPIRDEMKKMLSSKTVENLATNFENGFVFLAK